MCPHVVMCNPGWLSHFPYITPHCCQTAMRLLQPAAASAAATAALLPLATLLPPLLPLLSSPPPLLPLLPPLLPLLPSLCGSSAVNALLLGLTGWLHLGVGVRHVDRVPDTCSSSSSGSSRCEQHRVGPARGGGDAGGQHARHLQQQQQQQQQQWQQQQQQHDQEM